MTSTTQKTFRILAVLYALAIFGVSSLPGIKLPNLGISWSDKLAHFAQYGVFAFLVAAGWRRQGGLAGLRRHWRLLLLLIAYAAVDEFHQIWIPKREASFVDWIADSGGILLGFTMGLLLFRNRQAPLRGPDSR